MNETSKPTMNDESGNNIDGIIGSLVQVGVSTGNGSNAYKFTGGSPNDERLVQVPDDDRLEPGTGQFSVTLRIKTTNGSGPNIIQKGQARTTGGYWKFVLKSGWPRCHFRDANRNIVAIGFVHDSRPETKAADGKWHTISCERTTTGARVTIDGLSKQIKKNIGSVNNKLPMTIGGKLQCDNKTVGCDYYTGLVDWVKIEHS